jgi:murein DD-endopeptidase MepM/ murein hydrolase activator NlpD
LNIFLQSLQYTSIIGEKSEEISKLKDSNQYFQGRFNEMSEKLQKVNEYLISVGGAVQPVSDNKKEFLLPENIKESDLSKKDKHTLNSLKGASFVLLDIEHYVTTRSKKIESAISLTGLVMKSENNKLIIQKIHSLEKNSTSLENKGDNDTQDLERAIIEKQNSPLYDQEAVAAFAGNFDKLIALEKLAKVVPLGLPMKNFYLSSGFGGRSDPITHFHATHQGLDLIGVKHERIFAPSQGKVVLAGKFSNYGNAVVIDHGFGITTLYGHLSSIKVREGQFVKKGETIALQGSTGRSTGEHLHYEVRYKNIALNPKKFIDAGSYLSKQQYYVNS